MGERYTGRIDKFVGVDEPPTLSFAAFDAAEFAVTHVCWEQTEAGHPVHFDRADGYMVCLQRRDVPLQPYWVDDVPLTLRPMRAGQFLFLDLNQQHTSVVPGGVDCLSVFTSREVVSRFQAEHDHSPSGRLDAPLGEAHEDPVVRHLGESLMTALERPGEADQLYTDHVALALLSRLTSRFVGDRHSSESVRGGLAPWQQRRAKDMLVAHLRGGIGLEALARECRLSRSHFARAFKVSTGMSPLRWMTEQRIERAKALLRNSPLSLEQIATACGFADGSHFSRVFHRCMGVPPSEWRRIWRS